MNSWAGPELNIKALREGFWRVVCSYNCAEASGPIRGVALATRTKQSPPQVIEKKKLRSVPKLTPDGHFCDGQVFG